MSDVHLEMHIEFKNPQEMPHASKAFLSPNFYLHLRFFFSYCDFILATALARFCYHALRVKNEHRLLCCFHTYSPRRLLSQKCRYHFLQFSTHSPSGIRQIRTERNLYLIWSPENFGHFLWDKIRLNGQK